MGSGSVSDLRRVLRFPSLKVGIEPVKILSQLKCGIFVKALNQVWLSFYDAMSMSVST